MLGFYQCTVAISAVVGHCFPIWLRFKGGKGVATGFGVILSLNLNVGIVALLIWVLIAKVFKISSMSALFAYFLIPVLMFYYETEIIYFLSSFRITGVNSTTPIILGTTIANIIASEKFMTEPRVMDAPTTTNIKNKNL